MGLLDELAAATGGQVQEPAAEEPTPARAVVQTSQRRAPRLKRAAELVELARAEKRRRAAIRERELVLGSLFEFGVRAFERVLEPSTRLARNWHQETVAAHVQWQLEERVRAKRSNVYQSPAQNLVVNIPPRSLKTIFITVCGPAWAWLKWPELRVRALSTNPRVCNEAAYQTYRLITSEWYQTLVGHAGPSWEVDRNRCAPTNLHNTAGGSRVAVGYSGEIVGEGSDWLICDDPNDPDDVHSETKREAVNDRWDRSIANRVNDPRACCRTIVQQRTHEADLTGHLMAREREDWVHLCVPQEFDPDGDAKGFPTSTPIWTDPRTETGQLLHPSWFTPEFLAKEKKRLGSFGFAGQHNQRPDPADGGMFKRKWWKWCEPANLPTTFDRLLMSVDCSFGSLKESASRNAIGMFGTVGGARYLLDVDCRVGTFLQTVARIKEMIAKFPNVHAILVEYKANGSSVIETLQQEFPIILPFDPRRDSKVARAMAIQPQVEAGSVVLPRGAPWSDEFVHELAVFPKGAHDDMVDMLSQALAHLRSSPDAARLIAAYGR